jgi:hypothetical protein
LFVVWWPPLHAPAKDPGSGDAASLIEAFTSQMSSLRSYDVYIKISMTRVDLRGFPVASVTQLQRHAVDKDRRQFAFVRQVEKETFPTRDDPGEGAVCTKFGLAGLYADNGNVHGRRFPERGWRVVGGNVRERADIFSIYAINGIGVSQQPSFMARPGAWAQAVDVTALGLHQDSSVAWGDDGKVDVVCWMPKTRVRVLRRDDWAIARSGTAWNFDAAKLLPTKVTHLTKAEYRGETVTRTKQVEQYEWHQVGKNYVPKSIVFDISSSETGDDGKKIPIVNFVDIEFDWRSVNEPRVVVGDYAGILANEVTALRFLYAREREGRD